MARRVHIGQLIAAEVAVAAAAAALTGPTWLFAGVGACAGAVLVAAFGRTGGRWWFEAAAGHRRFVRRRRLAARGVVAAAFDSGRVPPELVWLRTLAPALRIRPVDAGGAGVIGVGFDEHGWFAAVGVDGAAGGLDDEDGVALARVGEFLDRSALTAAQVVVHPDGRVGWLAVRLSVVDAVGIERGAAALVATEAIRAARLLATSGLRAEALDPAGLAAALVLGLRLDGPPQEHWSYWRSGGLVHACYQADWPAAIPLVAPGVTLAVALRRGDPGRGVLVRITARPPDLAQACREVAGAAAAAGIRLRRLDGDHAPGAYATVATAAGLRH